MPWSRILNLNEACRCILVVIQSCSSGGKDATCEVTTYLETNIPVVVDLRTVGCVVGRVKRGNEWDIIDKSGEFSQTVIVDPEVEVE